MKGPARLGRSSTRLSLLILVGSAVATPACSRDIFDVAVALAPHSYDANFGDSSGNLPTVTCDTSQANDPCGAAPTIEGALSDGSMVEVAVGCDGATARCFAEADARLVYQLDVLQDDDFVSKVGRRAISFVRQIDLDYTVPTNTLTFQVPQVDVYVGPAGTRGESDPGVVLVDSVGPIGAGETFGEAPRRFSVGQGSAAHVFLEQTIRAKQPFVFVLVANPRLEAGAPLPAGGFRIDIVPTISLGLE